MTDTIALSLIAVMLWGIVGLLQKVTTNYITADAVLIWDRVGYLCLLPWLLATTSLSNLGPRDLLIGTLAGISNTLGAWFLYASLESGAKASIAVPLTSLYPLLTVLMAMGFLGEKVRPLQWFGIALALIAGILMTLETPADSQTKDAH
jgi:transporter family protein